jgi:hypothetical protein
MNKSEKQSSALVAAILSLAITVPSRTAHAQSAHSPAVIVAITDTLTSKDARAILLRSPSRPEDIVIMRRATASPEVLGAALALVDRLRTEAPTPTNLELTTMQGGAARQPLTAARMGVLTATLRRLAEQPVVKFGNLGSGQWVRLVNTTAMP